LSGGSKKSTISSMLPVNGEQGLFLADVNPYDLIILDVMLPDKDGISICREIRRHKIDTPILMLTALDTVKDKVRRTRFRSRRLFDEAVSCWGILARVRALLRKIRVDKVPMLVKIADLEQLISWPGKLTKRWCNEPAASEISLANKEISHCWISHAPMPNQVVIAHDVCRHVLGMKISIAWPMCSNVYIQPARPDWQRF